MAPGVLSPPTLDAGRALSHIACMQAAAAPAGWVIGVMVEAEDGPVRQFFAIGRADQARAEWAAVDLAVGLGKVATSPIGGVEPVQALAPLSPAVMARLGLKAGASKALGQRWPRRWLPLQGC